MFVCLFVRSLIGSRGVGQSVGQSVSYLWSYSVS